MAQERIDIRVSENGSRVVKRNLEDLGQSGTKVAGGMRLLQQAMLGLGFGAAALAAMRLADSYTTILNRLVLVTTGTENLAAVNDRLFASANRTYASYSATADLYGDLARASQTLGLGQEELLGITENINMAIAISGTEASTAANGLRQLGQGLAAGALRGDELNSVLENMPRLAAAIAAGMEVEVGQLKALAAEGKVTALEITNALQAAGPALREEFAQLTPTIAQSFVVLTNNLTRFVGELNNASGVGALFSRAILAIANNLDAIAFAAAAVGAAFLWSQAASMVMGVLGPMIALERALGATSAMSALYSIAMKTASGATRGLTVALLANPFTALLAVIALAVTVIMAFGDEVAVTADGAVNLKQAFFGALSLIWDMVRTVAGGFAVAWEYSFGIVNGWLDALGVSWSDIFSAIWTVTKALIDFVIGYFQFGFAMVMEVWNNFPGMMDLLFTSVLNLAAEAAEAVLNAWQVPLRFIAQGLSYINDEAGSALNGLLDATTIEIPRAELNAAGAQAAAAVGEGFANWRAGGQTQAFVDASIEAGRGMEFGSGALNPGGEATVRPATAEDDAANRGRDAMADQETRVEYLARLTAESQRASATSMILDADLRRVQEAVNSVNDDMRDKEWSILTPAEEAQYAALLTAQEEANLLMQARDGILQGLRQPEEDHARRVAALADLHARAGVTAEEHAKATRDLRLEYLAMQTDMASGLELGRMQVEDDNANVAGRAASNYAAEWNAANAPMRDLRENAAALRQLMQDDPINSGQYAARLQEMGIEALILKGNIPDATLFDGAIAGLAQFAQGFQGILPGLSASWGSFLQRIGDGFANTIGRAIVYGDNLGDSLKEVGRSAMAELISGLVKLGVQWIIMQVIGQTAQAALMATGMAAGAGMAAAWAPAAAMVSLATLGANSAPAMAGIAATNALAIALSMPKGFREGGFTGNGGLDEVMGVVHGKEFVVNAEATQSWLPLLEQINAGRMPGYRKGGLVGGSSAMSMGSRGSIDQAGAAGSRGDSISIAIDARGAENGVEEKIADALDAALPVFLARSRRQEEKVNASQSGRQRIGSNRS